MSYPVLCPVCGQLVENEGACEICGYPFPRREVSWETIQVSRLVWQHHLIERNKDESSIIMDLMRADIGVGDEPAIITMKITTILDGEMMIIPVCLRNINNISYHIETPGIVKCEWEKWIGNDAILNVFPINYGVTKIKIFATEHPEICKTIVINNLTENKTKEQKEVQFADFIVKANVFKCNDYHDIEEITATVNVVTPFGDTIPVTIDAGYCSTCDCYFMLTRDYEKLRQQGVPLCRVIDEEIFRTKWHLIKNGMDLNEESVLHQYGYSVNQKDNLSDIQRREILSKVIDEGLYTVPGLKSFLDWLIERARKARNRNMDSAIEKWQSDRNWIARNLSSPERDVEISSIHKKTYW